MAKEKCKLQRKECEVDPSAFNLENIGRSLFAVVPKRFGGTYLFRRVNAWPWLLSLVPRQLGPAGQGVLGRLGLVSLGLNHLVGPRPGDRSRFGVLRPRRQGEGRCACLGAQKHSGLGPDEAWQVIDGSWSSH
jgi:hypothetical protein